MDPSRILNACRRRKEDLFAFDESDWGWPMLASMVACIPAWAWCDVRCPCVTHSSYNTYNGAVAMPEAAIAISIQIPVWPYTDTTTHCIYVPLHMYRYACKWVAGRYFMQKNWARVVPDFVVRVQSSKVATSRQPILQQIRRATIHAGFSMD